MFLVPSLQDSVSTLSGSFLAFFFCCAVWSCVYDHIHPYLVSERIFLAENKAFPYPRRAGAHPRWAGAHPRWAGAHPRRAGAILWDAAATWPVVIFVAVAPKQRSQKLSVSWLTLYELIDRLPVSTGNFGRALQRHFSVDFQTQDVNGKIIHALNEHVLLLWIGQETAKQRPLEVCRRIDFAIDWRLRPLCSVTGTAASFVSRFSKPRCHWNDLFLL